MRTIAIITARGGSKGIPKKNLALLLGRPLLAYTAEAALAARRVDRVILSTDDVEIAEAGRRFGIDTPFFRPPELALDSTPHVPVLQHAVREIEATDGIYDAILTLQPTNPLRLPEDIDGAIDLFERTGADSVISFAEVGEKHPARMKEIDSEGWVADPPFCETFEGQPRQQLSKLYLRDGSVYLTRRDVLMDQHSLKGKRCQAWLMPPERACNIDTPLDLYIAEQLLRRTLVPQS